MLGILLWGYHGISSSNEMLDKTKPNYRFFMKSFYDCKECKTVTVVVGESVDKGIIKAFQVLSNKMGKKHAGATMGMDGVIENYEIFSAYNCPPPGATSSSFVIFIDKENNFCETISFSKSKQLAEIITTIYNSAMKAKDFKKEKWIIYTKRTVIGYTEKYEIIAPTQDVLIEFINYVASAIYKESSRK